MTRHLRVPLALDGSGSLVTLTQDGIAEVAQSVAVLLATRPGDRPAVPDYGAPDPTFASDIAGGLTAAVALWEPRANPVEIDTGPPTAVREVTARLGVRQ